MQQESLTVEQAQLIILHQRPKAQVERVLLSQASGRVLYTPVNAPNHLPPFDNSAMDGYAVRWRDIANQPVKLEIIGTIAAGDHPSLAIESGQAVRIMTGAPIPDGADTVVEQERCAVDGSDVVVESAPRSQKGSNIRRQGSYVEAGKPLINPNQRLNSAHIGLLASLQRTSIEVYRRPTVAIISTGNELTEIDRPLDPGQIVNSNAYMLEDMVRQMGAIPWVLPTAPDNPKQIERTFAQALTIADVVISTGGVSVGEFDYVRDVMNTFTGGMDFWKIRIKPGKPLAFGIAEKSVQSYSQKVPIFGLPGNPASSFVGFYLFVRPLLGAMLGMQIQDAIPQLIEVPTVETIKGARGRTRYVAGNFVRKDDLLHFKPLAEQSSGNVALFANATVLGVVEEETTEIYRGEAIRVHILP